MIQIAIWLLEETAVLLRKTHMNTWGRLSFKLDRWIEKIRRKWL